MTKVLFLVSIGALAMALMGTVLDGATNHSLAINAFHVMAVGIFVLVGIVQTVYMYVEKAGETYVIGLAALTVFLMVLFVFLKSHAIGFGEMFSGSMIF